MIFECLYEKPEHRPSLKTLKNLIHHALNTAPPEIRDMSASFMGRSQKTEKDWNIVPGSSSTARREPIQSFIGQEPETDEDWELVTDG